MRMTAGSTAAGRLSLSDIASLLIFTTKDIVKRRLGTSASVFLLVFCLARVVPTLDRDKNIDQYGHDSWTSQNALPALAVVAA